MNRRTGYVGQCCRKTHTTRYVLTEFSHSRVSSVICFRRLSCWGRRAQPLWDDGRNDTRLLRARLERCLRSEDGNSVQFKDLFHDHHVTTRPPRSKKSSSTHTVVPLTEQRNVRQQLRIFDFLPSLQANRQNLRSTPSPL